MAVSRVAKHRRSWSCNSGVGVFDSLSDGLNALKLNNWATFQHLKTSEAFYPLSKRVRNFVVGGPAENERKWCLHHRS